jgi:hypothetical protein
MVSILMPSLNQSRFLPAALDSILQQSHGDLELVVADGGSTDGSVEILRDRAARDPRLRWSSAQDTGPAAALNKAAALAQGLVMGWLSADDLYPHDTIEKVLSYFTQEPEMDFVYGHARFVDENGFDAGPYPTKGPEAFIEDFSNGCFICQPAAFFRREVWSRLGGLDESLRTSFDFDFWIRTFAQFPGRVGFIDHVLASSRQHAHTITATKRRSVALEAITILKRHLDATPPHWALTHIEEIMANHPDGSGQSLLGQIEALLEAARAVMKPEDFRVLKKRVADDRRIQLAGPSSFIAVHPDGWAGPTLTVRLDARRLSGLKITGRSGLPTKTKHRLSIRTAENISSSLPLRGGRSFALPLTPGGDATQGVATIQMTSNQVFRPSETEPGSNDHRELSFMVENAEELA